MSEETELNITIWFPEDADRQEFVKVLDVSYPEKEIMRGVKMRGLSSSAFGGDLGGIPIPPPEQLFTTSYLLTFGGEVAIGVAAHQVASYLVKKLKNYGVRKITVGKKWYDFPGQGLIEVPLDVTAVAKAFLKQIEEMETKKGAPM